MGSNDFITVFFLVAAVLIFLQLRSVLGRRTGNEKQPFEPVSPRDLPRPDPQDTGKVITLPSRDVVVSEDRLNLADLYTKPGSEPNSDLRELMKVDLAFDPKGFFNGARLAYEMIVTAYAEGDRKALRGLLSREVFESFDVAIGEREARGEKVKFTFVGISKTDLVRIDIKGTEVQVVLNIVSQLISATLDRNGTIIEGDEETVAEVNDIWTLSRDMRSRDPNWTVIATESSQ
nr:Tim44/TimA family putative adaptor protein [uncultured Gellertiella sp.]